MPELSEATNLIIAGTNKSGTTAVFRYLGDHPDVSLSRFKESEFFLKPLEDRNGNIREAYFSQFIQTRNRPRLFVEATPQYLPGGSRIARRIGHVLPNAKILFVLRNPADRIISYYRSSFGQPQLATYGVSFEQFVNDGISAMSVQPSEVDALPYHKQAFRQEFRISRYASFLPDFVDQFGAENVLVTFFDQLIEGPQDLIADVCAFAGIDSTFYDDYVFRVENKTRIHRSTLLRSVSGSANASLEPLLNRLPALRRAARSIYDGINVRSGKEIDIPDASREQLENFCAPWNEELRNWLQQTYPGGYVPDWRMPT